MRLLDRLKKYSCPQGHLCVLASGTLARRKGVFLTHSWIAQEEFKSNVSYRNDAIVVFFFATKKNKDSDKVVLASSNT